MGTMSTAALIGFCVFGLFALICGYIMSLSSKQEIKLLNRLPNTESENLRYELENQASKTKYGEFHKKVFGSKFANGGFEKYAKMLGVDVGKLEEQIYAARLEEKITVQEITSMKILGIAGMLVFGLAGIAMGFNMTLILLAVMSYLLGSFLPTNKITKAVKARKDQILIDLPNFIELVYSTLEAGSTIQEALTTIAKKSTGPLSEEFLTVAARTKISGKWKQEMEYIAEKCGVEEFNDLISDILISYEKGTSVVQVLKEDAEQLRAIKNAKINEKAKKLSITLLIPMAIFEFLPMFALMLAPMLVQFLENF